jgi:uncharacterized membrane protein YeiH
MTSAQALLVAPDAVAAVLLALSASVALPRRADPLTTVLAAAAAGLAGGVLRDLLLGAGIAFVREPALPSLALAAGGVGLALAAVPRAARLVPLLDAGGLAVLAAGAADKAAVFGVAPIGAVLIGALAGVVGGLVRDLAQRRAPRLLTSRFYGAAAVLGAGVVVLCRLIGVGEPIALGLGAAAAFLGRYGAIARRERALERRA